MTSRDNFWLIMAIILGALVLVAAFWGGGMKRTQIKRIGKTSRANIEARKKIADIAEQMGLNYCEIGLQGCLVTSFLAPAYRHKRSWYNGDAELLADYEQWVSACQNCHNTIENDKKLTERFFSKLRPVSL